MFKHKHNLKIGRSKLKHVNCQPPPFDRETRKLTYGHAAIRKKHHQTYRTIKTTANDTATFTATAANVFAAGASDFYETFCAFRETANRTNIASRWKKFVWRNKETMTLLHT